MFTRGGELVLGVLRAVEMLNFSAELFLKFLIADLNHRRPAVGAAVGKFASEKVFNKFCEFRLPEGVIGFDGMAADGLCDHVLTES